MSAYSQSLSKAEVQNLWDHYLVDHQVEFRNRLVEHYRPLVHIQAARLAQKLPAQVSFDEICSAGYDGLIEAVQAYDPSHKAKFETFCQRRIHGAVMDWLRELDVQSRTVRSFEKSRNSHRERLDNRLGRPPTDSELAASMDMSTGRYRELSRLAQLGHEVHLSAVQAEDDGTRRAGAGIDIEDDNAESPMDRVSRQWFTEYMTRGLNREERFVLVLYYYEGLTMAEIGQVLNLSESRVSQIHKDVLGRLRRRFYNEELTGLVA